ncbi:Protein CBG22535 [Caenorhabditis briggsae]|uniref:Protein CBG22535 n=1 Tax=Caenorhabditis briggsae TaxID=6238 RepID=A8Y2I0_CAEBR|nr:Protein CBG22535 [Caenorhabditis briggsae]CAP39102.2 Protein CBG22535 [Caenorhabditis briggsae]
MRIILIIRKWRHESGFIAYASVFLYLLFIILFTSSNDSIKIESSFKNVDTTRNGKEVCALPIYDFWHESVKPLLKGHNPMKNCDKTFRKWTELENGEWRIVKEGANCSARSQKKSSRCFEGIGAKKEVVFQEWMKPGKTNCEFIEAVCWENNTEAYGYTHSQIIPRQVLGLWNYRKIYKIPISRTPKPPETKFPSPPNVLVFTIDSLNTGMAKRSLPKFLPYFQSKFSGIEFPFVNKVGENSQPNGFPLWFGKRIEGGRTVAWEELKPDWNETEYCERFLDNETHIFKEFKQHGYARNHQILDDSFVLFVADHGLRFGYGNYFTTEIGSFERHNPYLAISVPKKYRGSETGLLDILKRNSQQLQTHFDTRATLLDILKFQPMFNFTDREHIKIQNEIGDSLIRKQPDEPRTCATLPIPQQYCICQVQKFEIRNKILQRNLGKKLVDHVRYLLAKSNVSQLCEQYDLEEVCHKLIEYDYTKSWNTYKISAKTTFSAHFETLMVYNENDGSVNFGKVVRLDTYGSTADCTKKVKFQALCHCKK